jgi:hypothetical protein
MIVVARPAGQLANRLFQFAQFVALAADAKVTVADPALGDYAQHFPAFANDAACRYPAPKRPLPPRLRGAIAGAASAGMRARPRGVKVVELDNGATRDLDDAAVREDLLAARLTLVAGWGFNGTRTFYRQIEEVRRIFAPSPECEAAAKAAVNGVRAQHDVLVGVHRRRGDYAHWNDGRFLFSDADYRRVMQSAADALVGSVGFLVCSDEPIDPRAFDDLPTAPGPGSPVEDLHALSLCDYIIGPPSTFSAWASFMGSAPRYELRDPSATVGRESFVGVRAP